MSEFFSVLWDFVLNLAIAYLIPTALTGTLVKVQKRRHVYPRGRIGQNELKRDCNLGLLGFNGLFLLWSLGNWPGVVIFALRLATVSFFVYFYHNRPLAVIAVPDTVITALEWMAVTMDGGLALIPKYNELKAHILAGRAAREIWHRGFSGGEISTVVGQQLLLSQTQFKCHSCGLEKDNSHLGDILQDENKQLLFFCDDTRCRIESRDMYSKTELRWKRRVGGYL